MSKHDIATILQGFNSFSGRAVNTAVTGTANQSGGPSTLTFTICTDVTSVMRTIGITADASYNFGFGSVSAKTEFLDTVNISTFNVTVVAYASRTSAQIMATDVQLKEGVDTSNLAQFCSVYGDCYVNSLQYGQEYIAFFVFRSQSESEQTSVYSSLTASGIGEAGSFSASISTTFDSIKSETQTFWEVKDQMFGMYAPSPIDIPGIVELASNLPSVPADEHTIISYELLGYESVPGMPDISTVIANRDLLRGTDVTDGLSANLVSLITILNAAKHVKYIQQIYDYQDTQLDANVDVIKQNLGAIDTLLSQMASNPTVTYAAPSLPGLGYGTPVLQFDLLNQTALWGSQTGPSSFCDIDKGAVEQGTILSALTFWGSDIIYGVDATYTIVGLIPHGQHSGSQSTYSFNLNSSPPETITGLTGVQGWYVNSVTLTTTRTPQWGPVPQNAQAGSVITPWTSPAGYQVIGVLGTFGDHLNQLGFTYLKMEDAAWQQTSMLRSSAVAGASV